MRAAKLILILLCTWCFATLSYADPVADPLPSWNVGPTKTSIIDFVHAVTDEASPSYVQPSDRIATFDNDGTLWVEYPMYTQFIFALQRVKELAPQHPEWKDKPPFSAIISGDKSAMEKMTMHDVEQLLAVTHSGMSVEEFQKILINWLVAAKDPHFNRLYTQLVYQPMLEVMSYLRKNNFKIYIVTGGGQDFVRAYAQPTYGVAPEEVVGSTEKTKYGYANGVPTLTKLPEVLFIDDHAGKPEAINLFIGKKPIIAFGNSDGDQQMLEWTQSNSGKATLMLLVHHDDAAREFSYGPKSKVGTFSDALMQEAVQKKWHVISMKDDWKVIFPVVSIASQDQGK
ncbi:MAG: HAD family hydrolase [Pseudomonadota bacterium]